MNKFLQTILFFALVTSMVIFIYSALRPAQYLIESEFLVISDSLDSGCENNLGSVLSRVIKSKNFQNDLKNKLSLKKGIILLKKIV